MRKILFYCFLITSSFFYGASAQSISVSARIDSALIWIGSQTRLTFEISQQPNQKVITPLFSDTIVSGLEIVEPLKNDTVKSPDGQVVISQHYTVTSFVDSLLYIPPYPFVLNGDTVWTKSLSLKVVQPFEIDTTANKFTDIKPVLVPKFYWKGLIKTVLLILAILLIIIALYFVIRRYIQKKPLLPAPSPESLLPPYVVAIKKLNSIKQQKLWQQNRSKEFHTELTDVVREYIERTFEIPSLEMTSDEIISHLNHLKFESSSAYKALIQILQLADLVKFAKWNPLPDEHELSLSNSFLFVEQTKIDEQVSDNEKETEALKID